MAEPTEGSSNQQEQPFLDFKYLYGTWTGRFKIAEFFTSLFGGALVPAAYDYRGAFGFVSFIAWWTFISVIFDIILHLVRIWDKIVFVHTYPQVLVCLCFLGAVSFGVGGILEIAVSQYAVHPGLGYASSVFILATGILLAIECYFHYQTYLEKRQSPAVEMSSQAAGPADKQDPNNFY